MGERRELFEAQKVFGAPHGFKDVKDAAAHVEAIFRNCGATQKDWDALRYVFAVWNLDTRERCPECDCPLDAGDNVCEGCGLRVHDEEEE